MASADSMPKTLLDVPDGVLVEQVYGRLSIKDRMSLSLTCKRLHMVALDGAVFSEASWVTVREETSERINDESFHAARLFRPKRHEFSKGAHMQLFLERYTQLSPDERWPIRALWVSALDPASAQALTTPLSAILPRLQNLGVTAPSGIQLDTQQLLTGLTNCTQLHVDAAFRGYLVPGDLLEVHAGIFSQMPRLRILMLGGTDITNIAQSPAAPMFNTLQRLTIRHHADPQELLQQLAAHMPHLRHLEVTRCRQLDTLPPGVFGLANLESLTLKRCENLHAVPEAITQLTNLTSFCIERVPGPGEITVGPHVGLLTTLSALAITGWSNTTVLLPRAIERLSFLTRLRLQYCRAGDEGLDLSRLRELRVLDASDSDLITNNSLHAGNFPHLRELAFRAQRAVPVDAFRAGLLKLVVQMAIGPLPLTATVASTLDLTDLELNLWCRELPDALGQLHALTRLCVNGPCALERLPLSLQNLVNLEVLEVTHTSITSLPPLGALTNPASATTVSLRSLRESPAFPRWRLSASTTTSCTLSGGLPCSCSLSAVMMTPSPKGHAMPRMTGATTNSCMRS